MSQNVIKTLKEPRKIQVTTLRLIKCARKEILGIFSTCNAFHRQERAGALELSTHIAKKYNVRIRILTPFDDKISQMAQLSSEENGIIIRDLDQASRTKVSLLVVDRRFSLAVELKDDAKDNSLEAIGLATYSNSPATVLSYAAIFESLWLQKDLYEKLKVHESLQNEFMSMAAHELRTPVQPMLALSQHLLSNPDIDSKQREQYLDIIVRNAFRLKNLTENILDITRIETNSLKLNMKVFDFNEIVLKCKQDAEVKLDNKIKVHLIIPKNIEGANFVKGDPIRLSQVMANLLNNSIKFTQVGEVFIILRKESGPGGGGGGGHFLLVQIKDTGSGIDPGIIGALFSKFVSKCASGTGLGLYISKAIVEAHGGSIWGENNSKSKGASFFFKLPIVNPERRSPTAGSA